MYNMIPHQADTSGGGPRWTDRCIHSGAYPGIPARRESGGGGVLIPTDTENAKPRAARGETRGMVQIMTSEPNVCVCV